MRFERRGGPSDLQSAFEFLIVNRLGGKALDEHKDQEAKGGEFPDFSCFNNLVLIEMKHLETDQSEKVDSVFERNLDPAEAPIFLGSRDSHLVTNVVSNGDAINAEIASKLSRTIEKILSKANSQFLSYRTRNPRKNAVNLCVILNSKLQEYSPEVMAYAFKGKLKLGTKEERFSSIDGILYISEKHFQTFPDGRVAFAMLICHTAGIKNNPWKVYFLNRIVESWSELRTGQKAEQDRQLFEFETVQDIPDKMPRSTVWSVEYQRKPYLKELTIDQLRFHFHRILALNSVSTLKGSWPKPPMQQTIEVLRSFQHANEEINRRGLDLRQFDYKLLSSEEKSKIYSDLPPEFVRIFDPELPNSGQNL